ncbi:MAG: hypothetical protein GF330_09640 [Candidatus Eisenbacteria bacterium]|nr:hypothetical protein [Candidatus Eisenbacteria bacterium]
MKARTPALALLPALLMAGMGAAAADSGCGPAPEEAPRRSLEGRSVASPDLALTCYPAQIASTEGQWTFLLRGGEAFAVEEARLVVPTGEIPAELDYPTPQAVLVELTYKRLPIGATAQLVVRLQDGRTTRFELPTVVGTAVPPDRRQPDRIRVQLAPWTLIYPLHGFGRGSSVDGRAVDELAGDEAFLGLLRDLGIPKVRKVLSSYAEDDSVHWDESKKREILYSGRHLRQYLVFIQEGRSELAHKEIFLAFPQVEEAFVNEDRSRR